MQKYRFGSDTNAQLFGYALEGRNVKHEIDSNTVEIASVDANEYVDADASSLGGWTEPDPRSTIGAQPFSDIGAFGTRSNPPAFARGGEPVEPRKIGQTFRGGGQRGLNSFDQLTGGLPPRRSTRGQPK